MLSQGWNFLGMIGKQHYNHAMASQITDNLTVCSSWQQQQKSKHYWPFVLGIHRWPVDSLHKGPVMLWWFPCYDVLKIFSWWLTEASHNEISSIQPSQMLVMASRVISSAILKNILSTTKVSIYSNAWTPKETKKTMTKLILNTGPAVGARPSAGSVRTIQAQGRWWPGSDLVKSQQRSLREKKKWLFYPTHQYSSWYFHSKDLLGIAFITKKQLLC